MREVEKKIKQILTPIKRSNGCGIEIFLKDGKVFYGYFGYSQKLPKGTIMEVYPLVEAEVEWSVIIEDSKRVIQRKFKQFQILEGTSINGEPGIKLYLD